MIRPARLDLALGRKPADPPPPLKGVPLIFYQLKRSCRRALWYLLAIVLAALWINAANHGSPLRDPRAPY